MIVNLMIITLTYNEVKVNNTSYLQCKSLPPHICKKHSPNKDTAYLCGLINYPKDIYKFI